MTEKRENIEQNLGVRPRVRPLELTPREQQVLQLITNGLDNKSVASALSVAEGTVKFHINNIFMKLGVRDRTQAVVYGLKLGLVKLE